MINARFFRFVLGTYFLFLNQARDVKRNVLFFLSVRFDSLEKKSRTRKKKNFEELKRRHISPDW